MTCTTVWFTGPGSIELRQGPVPAPAANEVLVRARFSAISAGTELLILHGLFPPGLAKDETIPALAGKLAYPLQYGYSVVGEVIALGSGVDPAWLGRRVFCFHPHASHFLAQPAELLPIPADITSESALFLPSVETAVNLVMDGQPMVGERVAVFGQGIVGLLTTTILARFPLEMLVTFDHLPLRRQTSLALGALLSFDPGDGSLADAATTALRSSATEGGGGADLVFELSGNPQALNAAIEAAAFGGRVVIGSWYGAKNCPIELGGAFHRRRLTLTSSQVSTLAPKFSGQWTKERRMATAWSMIKAIEPVRLISHTLPIGRAREGYALAGERSGEALQIVFAYDAC